MSLHAPTLCGHAYHGAPLSESIAEHREPGAEHAERLHAIGVVVFGWIAFQIGVAVAAWIANFLGLAIAWTVGAARGYFGWSLDAPPAAPGILVLSAATWLLLAAVILAAASRFASPRIRRSTVGGLTLLIGATQLLRLASPLWLSPWQRYHDVFSSADRSSYWILAYVYLPMHRIWLICCVAALPAIAWYALAREKRRSRELLENGRQARVSRPWLLVPPRADSRRVTLVFLSTMVALFIGSSVVRIFHAADQTQWQFSTARILSTVLVELVLIAFWLPRLRRGGWTLGMTTRDWQGTDILRGAALCVVTLLVVRGVFLLIFITHRPLAMLLLQHHGVGPLSLWAIPPLVLINPVFEEILYLGIAANTLRDRLGNGAAFWCVVALRVLVHAYQGPVALTSILPVALLYTWYYFRTQRLWPLIIAHMALDLLALVQISMRHP